MTAKDGKYSLSVRVMSAKPLLSAKEDVPLEWKMGGDSKFC